MLLSVTSSCPWYMTSIGCVNWLFLRLGAGGD